MPIGLKGHKTKQGITKGCNNKINMHLEHTESKPKDRD